MNLPVIDRSTLEAWQSCPFSGYARDHRLVLNESAAADAGNESHNAISRAVTMFSDGLIPKLSDFVAEMQYAAEQSRTDVADVAAGGVKGAMWPLARHIMYAPSGDPRSPLDILRHDGGTGEKSGQLAWEFEDEKHDKVMLTCRVDLLLATASEEEVELNDWKSGFATWSADDVASSFQFGVFYPTLVLLNYPGANAVRVRIWNTRFGAFCSPFVFTRRIHMPAAMRKISAAMSLRAKYFEAIPESVPTWPDPLKCSMCPAVTGCPRIKPITAAGIDTLEPGAMLESLVVLEEATAVIRKRLDGVAKACGGDFVHGRLSYGISKPKAMKTPARDPYLTPTYEPDEQEA